MKLQSENHQKKVNTMLLITEGKINVSLRASYVFYTFVSLSVFNRNQSEVFLLYGP